MGCCPTKEINITGESLEQEEQETLRQKILKEEILKEESLKQRKINNHSCIILESIENNSIWKLWENPEIKEYLDYLSDDEKCEQLLDMEPYNKLLLIEQNCRIHLLKTEKTRSHLLLTKEGTGVLYKTEYRPMILNSRYGNDLLFNNLDDRINQDLLLSTPNSASILLKSELGIIILYRCSNRQKILLQSEKGKCYLLANKSELLMGRPTENWLLTKPEGRIMLLNNDEYRENLCLSKEGSELLFNNSHFGLMVNSNYGIDILIKNDKYEILCEKKRGIEWLDKNMNHDFLAFDDNSVIFPKKILSIPDRYRKLSKCLMCGCAQRRCSSPGCTCTKYLKENGCTCTKYLKENYISLDFKKIIDLLVTNDEGRKLLLKSEQHYDKLSATENGRQLLITKYSGCLFLLDKKDYDNLLLSTNLGRRALATIETRATLLLTTQDGMNELLKTSDGKKKLSIIEDGRTLLFRTRGGLKALGMLQFNHKLQCSIECPLCRENNDAYVQINKNDTEQKTCCICSEEINHYVLLGNCDHENDFYCEGCIRKIEKEELNKQVNPNHNESSKKKC